MRVLPSGGAVAGAIAQQLEDAWADVADRAGAEGDDDVAGAAEVDDRGGDVGERGHDVYGGVAALGDFVRERLDGDAGEWIFAGAVDIGQDDLVGAGEGAAEFAQEVARARVAVRLEGDEDAARHAGAGGGEDGGDFGRVVAVVVDDHDAVGFAENVEAAFGAFEFGERAGDTVERDAQLEADGDGGEGVEQVVAAGDAEAECAEVLAFGAFAAVRAPGDDAAGGEGFERRILADQIGVGESRP